MSYQFPTENPKMLRACVFIDSSNPALPNQIMKNSSHPFIKPPFPPLIDPKDLLIIGKDNKPSRSPNAFIIYRKVFFKTTRDQGYFLPMTIVSSMASKSWDQEPEEVRNYYKSLAKEAYNYRTERFPKKVRRRRKKEPWNTDIAFQNDLYNTFFDDTKSKRKSKLQSTEKINETQMVFQDSSSSDISSQNSSPSLEQQTLLFNEYNLQELNASNLSSPNMMTNDILCNQSDQPYLYDYPEFNLPVNFGESYDQSLCQGNEQADFISFNNNFNLFPNQNDYFNNTLDLNATTDLLNSIHYPNVFGINLGSTGSEYENSFQL